MLFGGVFKKKKRKTPLRERNGVGWRKLSFFRCFYADIRDQLATGHVNRHKNMWRLMLLIEVGLAKHYGRRGTVLHVISWAHGEASVLIPHILCFYQISINASSRYQISMSHNSVSAKTFQSYCYGVFRV